MTLLSKQDAEQILSVALTVLVRCFGGRMVRAVATTLDALDDDPARQACLALEFDAWVERVERAGSHDELGVVVAKFCSDILWEMEPGREVG